MRKDNVGNWKVAQTKENSVQFWKVVHQMPLLILLGSELLLCKGYKILPSARSCQFITVILMSLMNWVEFHLRELL